MPSETETNRYLIVDDDIAFCSVLERAITRRGFSTVIAHDGNKALETAENYQPSHAIIDLKLANESGLHLIEPLLQLKEDMKIVVLTGYGNIPTAVQAVKAGAINYLAKPVDVDTLLAAFDTVTEEQFEAAHTQPMSLRRLEWEHIQRVLNENKGNISATAKSLGMHRRTLQRKLQKRPVKQ